MKEKRKLNIHIKENKSKRVITFNKMNAKRKELKTKDKSKMVNRLKEKRRKDDRNKTKR
tara:strand:+ start:947 stop:1123 length:177 start_codon:yes stop_codon:yes gene_type:complete